MDSTTTRMDSKNTSLPWDIHQTKSSLIDAFNANSEAALLKILKDNSFLFYVLFSRKHGIQPIFHEVSFGNEYRCDFAWLNDNSDGPEWTLVEIEQPKLPLFKKNGDPTHKLFHAIEQLSDWRRYFENNPQEKKRIFGAVGRFRYILVAGSNTEWESENAAKWRADKNKVSDIEIRSSNIFFRAIEAIELNPDEFWSFAENPVSLPPSGLEDYWKNYSYMDSWRKILA